MLQRLVEHGHDQLALPGGGDTLARWRALACVAAADLSLVKLFEGHTDALAILAELSGSPEAMDAAFFAAPQVRRWGTWCAEPPTHRLSIVAEPENSASDSARPTSSSTLRYARLNGAKAWCSGAASISHAVVSGWNAAGEPCLAAVALDQPGVTITDRGWHAVGMRASGSVDVVFDDAIGVLIGAPGAYVHRPGFLHGGAGVAACWYGGLVRVADTLRLALSKTYATPAPSTSGASTPGASTPGASTSAAPTPGASTPGPPTPASPDPHRLAHLGAIDVAMVQARAALRDAAAYIDAHPQEDCALVCARARLAVEAAASGVLERAGRALGAGPLCRDAAFAQLMADLPVFIRQSHAERDQAAHGAALLKALHPDPSRDSLNPEPPWAL